jgi:anti-sigma factor ChrR (cupin superfamily)
MTNELFDDRELDELGPLMAASLDPVAPPASVRAVVLAAIRNPGRTVRSGEGKWYRQPVDGIEVKPLSLDRDRGIVTLLMKFAPGAVYPAHEHGGAEECFVVSGSCRIADVHLNAGDFHHADSGSHHAPVISDGGCTLLLVIDADDYVAA